MQLALQLPQSACPAHYKCPHADHSAIPHRMACRICPFVIYNQHFSQHKAGQHFSAARAQRNERVCASGTVGKPTPQYLTHVASSVPAPQTGTNSSHPQLVNRREMVAGSTDIRYTLQFRVSRAPSHEAEEDGIRQLQSAQQELSGAACQLELGRVSTAPPER